MAGTATIREGATTGYSVDAPAMRALIEETEWLASRVESDAEWVELLKPTLKPFRSGWSNLPCADPADS